MIKIFGNRYIKRYKSFESTLIRFLCIMLVGLLLSTTVMYYYLLQNMYLGQIRKSNESLVEQVAISYETIMKHITDSIYKISLYDNEMVSMINSYKTDSSYTRNLFTKMDSIVLGNQYLFSCYLYFPETGLVFDSQAGTISRLEEFSDQAIFEQSKRNITYIVDPHHVETTQGRKLLVSVVTPMPISLMESKGILVVNIDARRLYQDIMKKIKTEDRLDFLVYNKDNVVLIDKDESLLFQKIEPSRSDKGSALNFILPFGTFNRDSNITSQYYSSSLKWTFLLETTISSPKMFFSKLYVIFAYSMALIVIGLMLTIFMVKRSARPVKKKLDDYNEKLWKDFLVGGSVDTESIKEMLQQEELVSNRNALAVILLQNQQGNKEPAVSSDLLEVIRNNLSNQQFEGKLKPVIIDRSHVGLIVSFKSGSGAEECRESMMHLAGILLENLSEDLQKTTFISCSTIKDTIFMIPMAYRECIEALDYKIANASNIIHYSRIKENKRSYKYPYDTEKQLLNNIALGNREESISYFIKFFGELASSETCLKDADIKSYIFQLENSILKSISELPVSIKTDSAKALSGLWDINSIRLYFMEFIESIIEQVISVNEKDELYNVNRIFDLIDRKYMEENFNLNAASDELNLNRNLLIKIVKERTTETFNDYVNRKRINLAKQLLQDKGHTIEDVAHRVGFNYSHYFIKVFKSFEGVTPGQYRDRLCRTTAG